MNPCRLTALALSLFSLVLRAETLDPHDFSEAIRVACVGDSITAGSGTRDGRTYPVQLQEMLGPNWDVRNFGVSGRTLMRSGDYPYWKESAYQQAMDFRPDAVVILLGANDTKPHNWRHKEAFAKDYHELVKSFAELSSKPRIYVCRPVPVVGDGNFGINEPAIQEEIAIIDRIAGEMKLELIDLHAPLEGKPELIPDRVHPDNAGSGVMAQTVAVALSGSVEPAETLVQLNSLFRDHAVLPRGVELPVWGISAPGSKLTVSFAGQEKSGTAGEDGRWTVTLDPLEADSEPSQLTVSGNRTVTVDDLLVGDVWLASGQSNMERRLGLQDGQKPIIGWEEAVRTAELPLLREYHMPRVISDAPVRDERGGWVVCTPETAEDFSAVGFFFGRDLQRNLNIPIGIIHSSWGGTRAEAWTSIGALKTMPDFAEQIRQMEAGIDHQQLVDQWIARHDPGSSKPGWSAVEIAEPNAWKVEELPLQFEKSDLGIDDGIVWFRREIELSADDAARQARLKLGRIDDQDVVWINGREIGSTGIWTAPRDYAVPPGVLKEGRNVIAVRITDTGGLGGWMDGADALKLETGEHAHSLSGPWQTRVGVDFRKTPMSLLAAREVDQPARLFNGMIAPLPPFPIKGVVWYQGESNNDNPAQYRRLLPTLIGDWRDQFQQPDLPFYVVQIAPHRDMTPQLRDAQLQAVRATPHAALVVTTDVGDAGDIHPADKQPVGHRLALAARALTYGEKIEYSGPQFRHMSADGPKAVLHFDHAGGLRSEGALKGFEIAGRDGPFFPASAEIRGETVVVGNPEVSEPAAVRYGWSHVPEANLTNGAGLPASPFDTRTMVPVVMVDADGKVHLSGEDLPFEELTQALVERLQSIEPIPDELPVVFDEHNLMGVRGAVRDAVAEALATARKSPDPGE
ncbi:GDSL-type esterase/lipase family protein [Haloferula sargassicola]|uniref:Acetylxylan esterase n=1 Tax=Haloferula sargassicola TaxID=490096 RepID=A0ABP9UPB7_9BACT